MMVLSLLTIGNTIKAQCPNITVDAKYDHVPSAYYRSQHWDTAVTCTNPSITLSTTPFVTTQNFNGTYLVESIPYDPPDTTFKQGTRLSNISSDDCWDNAYLPFDFPFQFFGVTKTQALVGSNGIISFKSSVSPGSHCAYSYNTPIPNNNFVSTPDDSYGSIYGVYEDIDPGATQSTYGSYTSPGPHQGWGIYKFVGGEYPCRYLSTSVCDLVQFGNNSKSCTYSIVCWEGTNIVDVYIKQRQCCSSTNSGKGIVGIMNDAGSSAFVAPGRNGWTGDVYREAWRFTPQGNTVKNVQWFMLQDNGDSVEVGRTQADPITNQTHAYYVDPDDKCDIIVNPTVPTKYVVSIKYFGATGYFYYLKDTIFVGVDTSAVLSIASDVMTPNTRTARTCFGQRAKFNISYPSSQSVTNVSWSAMQVADGVRTVVEDSRLTLENRGQSVWVEPATRARRNMIDTIILYTTVTFANGCNNNDSVYYYIYPNFDIDYNGGICDGEVYHFWGRTFSQEGDYTERMQSAAGCDSVEHLHLKVSNTSFTTDTVFDCEPFTWINGKTYTMSNSETSATDTVRLKNLYGCDSTVRLQFTLVPVTARIMASPENATMEHLDITLTDVSRGGGSRRWTFPDGNTYLTEVCTYSFPARERDSAVINLTSFSEYGQCSHDTTYTIHLLRESLYMPNAFTPTGDFNKTFKPIGVGIHFLEFKIFDRRGMLVGSFEGTDAEWDGTNMSGYPCPQGNYIYIVRYSNVVDPNAIQVKQGTVTLIR